MAEFHVHQAPEAHFTVYQIFLSDGRRYIGCTGNTLAQRRHTGYSNNPEMRRETERVGKKNLRLEPICEKLTQEGAWRLEDLFIELYRTRDARFGCNSFTGGSRTGAKAADSMRERTREISTRRAADPSCAFAKGGNRHAVPVRCVETGEEFPTIAAAARASGVDWSGILRSCKDAHRRSAGRHWEFLGPKEKCA